MQVLWAAHALQTEENTCYKDCRMVRPFFFSVAVSAVCVVYFYCCSPALLKYWSNGYPFKELTYAEVRQ